MRLDLERAFSAASDGLNAAHKGIAVARNEYRETRRRRGESAAFSSAFDKACSIPGWLRRSEAELLFELARAVPAGEDIVEIGSYLGRSTAFLAMGIGPGSTVHAVDPHTGDRSQIEQGLEGIDTSKQFHRNMVAVGVEDRIETHLAMSVEAARSYAGRLVGLLFVDGWHSEAAVFDDGIAWSGHLSPSAFLAFDDIAYPEIARGVKRLTTDGVIPEIAGRVGKVGLCGPSSSWPGRVAQIVRTT